MNLAERTLELVSISSPTKSEENICEYLTKWLHASLPGIPYSRHRNNLLVLPPQQPNLPTIGLFGHLDTVPCSTSQPLEIKDGRVYGCGSTDMKSGLALMMDALENYEKHSCNIVGVFYEGEEGPEEGNGLKDVMDALPPMDYALVLEPTNNCICAGCMGGMHATVVFEGKRAHSARPWEGQNAIYRALPVIAKLRDRPRYERIVNSLTFYEVITVTQAHTQNTANVVPDRFELNVNIRFAPGRTATDALADLTNIVGDLATVTVRDTSKPGEVCISHPLIQEWIDMCNINVEPKQAWTDLSRLTAHGIQAVNFGPGDPSRAHQAVEWVEVQALETGKKLLDTFLGSVCKKHPKAEE